MDGKSGSGAVSSAGTDQNQMPPADVCLRGVAALLVACIFLPLTLSGCGGFGAECAVTQPVTLEERERETS